MDIFSPIEVIIIFHLYATAILLIAINKEIKSNVIKLFRCKYLCKFLKSKLEQSQIYKAEETINLVNISKILLSYLNETHPPILFLGSSQVGNISPFIKKNIPFCK